MPFPPQIVSAAMAVKVGIGFTVIVKVSVAPAQVTPALVKVGVTVIVAIKGSYGGPSFKAVKEGILPVPEVGLRPIDSSILHE